MEEEYKADTNDRQFNEEKAKHDAKKRENEVKEFAEIFEDIILGHIDDEADELDTINEIHDADVNYNNCDRTSGQRIYAGRCEISSLLDDAIKYLASQNDDRCSECGSLKIEQETSSQTHPYGDSGAVETYVSGMRCNDCGYEEKY